jgi:hypothetical protein
MKSAYSQAILVGLVVAAMSAVFDFGFGWSLVPHHSTVVKVAVAIAKGIVLGVVSYFVLTRRNKK